MKLVKQYRLDVAAGEAAFRFDGTTQTFQRSDKAACYYLRK
jgi:hypothetical protein